uniref:Uncharacterized protein n=1 Tax=Rhizophora mucronata TaxID=61149 RepID=A0A2P2PXM3_RHIMU
MLIGPCMHGNVTRIVHILLFYGLMWNFFSNFLSVSSKCMLLIGSLHSPFMHM